MKAAKRSPVAGTKFKSPRGLIGTVLAAKSADGKVQARFNCSNPKCKRTHERVTSDWHQVSRCRFCVSKGIRE